MAKKIKQTIKIQIDLEFVDQRQHVNFNDNFFHMTKLMKNEVMEVKGNKCEMKFL